MTRPEDFKTIEGVAGHRVLWVESSRIDKCMEFFIKGDYDGIGISPRMGYTNHDTEFLKEHPSVDHIVLLDIRSLNLSGLHSLTNLSYMQLSGFDGEIDFRQFPKLRHLRVEWTTKMTLPDGPFLDRLALRRYKPKSRNLVELPPCENLRVLEIVQSPMITLSGIQWLSQLERIEIAYLSKLEDISSIACLPQLSVFHCDHCKKIKDFSQIGHSSHVKSLRLNSCGTVPSLSFIDDLSSLEQFRFVDTNVEDGNLAPCLRLKSVSFTNKKHYSHRLMDIKKAIGDHSP